jgi:hypothetical protein
MPDSVQSPSSEKVRHNAHRGGLNTSRAQQILALLQSFYEQPKLNLKLLRRDGVVTAAQHAVGHRT